MVIVYHPEYATHVQFRHHPEAPFRMEYIIKKVAGMGISQDMVEAAPASYEDILATHRETYFDKIRNSSMAYLDGETVIHDGTFDVAVLAAGGAITAMEESALRNQPAFAIVRPPGHHAGPDYGGGFCYFNNVGVAAKKSLKRWRRVAIVDIDAHHGNGTQDIFYSDPNVLYISTHQWHIYPGTGNYTEIGDGAGKGFNLNIPLPARSGDSTYSEAFESIVLPVLEEYRPDVLFVSLGVDAHYKDDMSGLELSSKGYLDIAESLQKFAEKRTSKRLVYSLEGGYNGLPLSEVVSGVISLFEGKRIHLQYDGVKDVSIKGKEYIDRSRKLFQEYWKL